MPEPDDRPLMEASLERVAERCEDLTPPVYARFFARHPETAAMFVDELGRGRMLWEIIETCLELAEGRSYAPGALACLASDHAAYGEIPPALYRAMLDAFVDTLAEVCGAEWTPDFDAAWRRQAERMAAIIDQALRALARPRVAAE